MAWRRCRGSYQQGNFCSKAVFPVWFWNHRASALLPKSDFSHGLPPFSAHRVSVLSVSSSAPARHTRCGGPCGWGPARRVEVLRVISASSWWERHQGRLCILSVPAPSLSFPGGAAAPAQSCCWIKWVQVTTVHPGFCSSLLTLHSSRKTASPQIAFIPLPGSISGKGPTYQCRRHKRLRFNPWVGKIPWQRARQPTPVSLPGESHGQRSPRVYSPQGHKESDTAEATQHTHTSVFSPLGHFLLFKVKGTSHPSASVFSFISSALYLTNISWGF